MRKTHFIGMAALFVGLGFAMVWAPACSSNPNSDAGDGGAEASGDSGANAYPAKAVTDMRTLQLGWSSALVTDTAALCTAMPSTAAAWQVQANIDAMKVQFIKCRHDYELVEGAVTPIYPQLDHVLDGRYDDFLAELLPIDGGTGGDQYLFDDNGVVGAHGVERFLYLPNPAAVVAQEVNYPGYKVAALPSTDQEALDAKNLLCKRFNTDATTLNNNIQTSTTFDIATAFQGLVSLMNEQKEKVKKAASAEEESRYSMNTMADLRDNLSSTRQAWNIFRPWVQQFTTVSADSGVNITGTQIDLTLQAKFTDLDTAYSAISGDSIPPVPGTWTDPPSQADQATPFGQLYESVLAAVDPNSPNSIVYTMNEAAALLGFPAFVEPPPTDAGTD
jgi:iron uptake system EfeUOB component EfeO/EfeM